MLHADFTQILIVAAVIGAIIPLTVAYRRSGIQSVTYSVLIACAISGVGVLSGIDLVICGANPSHLVEIDDARGGATTQPVRPVIEQMHRIDIAIAGLVLLFFGASTILEQCEKIP